MARKKSKCTELSVFKGREAKLNRAIFKTIIAKGPQTIYDIHKHVIKTQALNHTRYANVNLRVRALQEAGYLMKTGLKRTKSGFNTILFDVTNKAYLALVWSTLNSEDLFSQLDEARTLTLLSVLLNG